MLMKPETYNYCWKTTNHAKWYFDQTKWVVWTNIQLPLEGFFVLFWFLGHVQSYTGRTSGPILTIYTSYDVFPCKDVPFWGSVDISPHLGGQIAKEL